MRIVLTLLAMISFAFCSGQTGKQGSLQTPKELVADNGIITVKFDLTWGGAISWISKSGSTHSLVNIADEGRYIQQSYYAGKSLDRKADGQSPSWSPWSWNPIQVGDAFRNRARILDYKESKDTLYVKCIPMQWDIKRILEQV